jgi:3'-phosphoadenosine 5'-phosphosulfate sulfotransferase (PAPS reductase)/FAD synthetase
MSNLKVIVQFSGGKDSTAALLYTIEHIAKNPIIVFCDTGFESMETYSYIDYVESKLNMPIKRIRNNKYNGMFELAEIKKRFPSTQARFCTEELKIKPMIDFVLNLNESFLSIQGFRKDESIARSRMNEQCTFFKYYFEPYGKSNKGKDKYHTYRKKEVKEFCKTKAHDLLRPIFSWTSNDVVAYIKNKGFELNPLYSKGFKRVGCFPCIMANQTDIKMLNRFYPERIKEISSFEIKAGHSFFPPNYIPKRFCSNKSYPTILEVIEYLKEHTLSMFPDERTCLSYYNICE